MFDEYMIKISKITLLLMIVISYAFYQNRQKIHLTPFFQNVNFHEYS